MKSPLLKRLLPWFVVLVLITVLVLWMAEGLLEQPEPLPETTRAEDFVAPQRVRVEAPTYEMVSQTIEITGKTAPNRIVRLRAATNGTVVALNAKEGNVVTKGQLLIRLTAAERNSRLTEAKALESQEQLQYASVKKLHQRALASQLELTQASARLQSAKAAVKAAREALADTRITAPFDGIITEQSIELGDFVTPGSPMLLLAEITPTLVEAALSERDLATLSNTEATAAVTLATGENINGHLRYIAPQANPSSNTFAIEIALITDQSVRLGVTAQVVLTLNPTRALRLNSDQIELDANGGLIVKYVNTDNQVAASPVRIIHSTNQYMWVLPQALPANAGVIVAGSGFTQVGDRVEPIASTQERERG